MYPRLLKLSTLPPYQSFFLFGPRATGKSTLVRAYLHQIRAQSVTYDLLKNEEFLRLQVAPSQMRAELEAQLNRTNEAILHVFIDEVQKIPALLDEVHFLIEKHPKKIRFILSGSSARKLKRGGANLLGGRAWQKSLFPLTSLEIGENFSLIDALQYGTLPPILDKSPEEKREQLHAYVNTYLKEEVQAEALTRNLAGFHRFLEAAALVSGELVNLSAVAQEAQIPRKTVTNYYQILEDTLVGFFLPSWGHRLSRKELVTHGKFLFFDLGIVNTLNHNLGGSLSEKNPLFGRLFEQFCILELMRIHTYKNTEHRMGFYRTRAGAEVDLVFQQGEKFRALEIKSTQTIGRAQLSGLKSFAEDFPHAEKIVICNAPRAFQIDDISCMPWKDFFISEWGSNEGSD